MRRICLLALTALLGAGLGVLPAAPAAADEVHERPANGVFELDGHGWGHGRGMSQWGAQGAATLGRTADEITSTYYPGTARQVLADTPIRVWLAGDEGRDTVVSPATGLRVTDAATGASALLPSGPTRWRVVPSGTGLQLQSLTGSTWTSVPVAGRTGSSGPLRFSGPTFTRVWFPDGTSRDYRGSVQAVRSGTALKTVVTLGLEDYLLGVVPREAPSGWRPAALQAQAIAARSYSAYKRERVRAGSLYDICDTTSCQVFGGSRLYSTSGRFTELEPASTTDAVRATRGVVRTWSGRPIFAEFSSSNGGWSTVGDVPYLSAREDRWDGVLANGVSSWTARLPVTALERRFPSLGTLLRLRVTARDGNGEWGGRVRSVVLEGSRGTVTTTGEAVRAAASWPSTREGLRSSWWRIRSTTGATVTLQSAAPSLVRSPGVSRGTATVTLRNSGSTAWPVAGLHLALAPSGAADALAGGSSRPGTLLSTTRAGATSVLPGESAVLRVLLSAGTVPAGTHARSYRLRVNDGPLFGDAVSWRVPVSEIRYTAVRAAMPRAVVPDPAGDAPAPVYGGQVVVPRTGSTTVRLAYRNTGNAAWPGSGTVQLGTAAPRNRTSLSTGPTWLTPQRGARMAAGVPVGGTGTMDVVLSGNSRPVGVSVETFEPAWAGRSWLSGAVTPMTVVRVDPRVSRLASLHSAPRTLRLGLGRTTTLVVRLRNLGGSAWTVGREPLVTDVAEPLRTSAWPSPSRPPALAVNVTRPGGTAVHPGEVGEWRVPLVGRRVGTFRTVLRAAGPTGRYGPAVVTTTSVVR